jgi:glycosyltransferase involved in cell wall biosynthesis
MMKICFFSAIHAPFDVRVFQKEARTLADSGIGTVFHICNGEEKPFVKEGVHFVPYGFTYNRETPPNRLAKFGRLFKRLLALRLLYKVGIEQKADVYHCNGPESWIIGLMVAKKVGAVCIFDAHEDYGSTFTTNYLPPFMGKIVQKGMKWLLKTLCSKTDYVILAKKTIDDQYPMPSGQKICVTNYAALSTLERIKPKDNQRNKEDPLWLVHSGGISRARGWPQLLEALSLTKRKDIFLHIFGVFMDGSKSAFEERVKELCLENRIRVDDWVTHEKSYEFISAGHVGLMTLQPHIQNHIFAMPNKMFDYMVMGLPCIGPDFAVEVAEITRESEAGVLLDPSQPKALASAFDYFADHEEERLLMGQKGREAVLTRYNWEADSQKLLDLYRKIAQERGFIIQPSSKLNLETLEFSHKNHEEDALYVHTS